MKTVHERELERRMREQYARGYEDGMRSMDAEHYAVALRLKHLPLDEDSYGNLSQIASAIWHSDFGWTQGACRALRDELVRLMGGVSAPPTYDVLGNERHRAVCELRKLDAEDNKAYICSTEIARAIGLDYGGTFLGRLIHLLGGDETEMSLGTRLSQANVDAMSRRAKSCKGGETIKLGGECDGKIMENGENHKIATITDELREFVAETWDGSIYVNQIPKNLQAIADRIDEQEHKLRKQRDGFRRGMVAAQDLLEKRTDERDELQKKLDAMREVLNGS